MRKRDVVLCRAADAEQAMRVVVLMASMEIGASAAEIDDGGSYAVHVDAVDADEARRILQEEYPRGLPRVAAGTARRRHARIDAPATWFGRGSWMVLAVIAACTAVHLYIHGNRDPFVDRARMIDVGAITWALVDQGEAWRLLAAIFIHFDAGHLIANMGTLLLLGPPFAHTVGPWRFSAVFLVAGVTGNLASHHLAPSAALKAGASGAIAGVLGGLCGHALRRRHDGGRRFWPVIGALAAFYGLLIGFGPGRDNVAHLGGMLAGVVFGWLIEADDAGAAPLQPPRL